MTTNSETTNFADHDALVPSIATTPAPLAALVYDPAIGIIGHLRSKLWAPEGVTKREMVAHLTVLFPDRDPIGMGVTVGIQLGRLQKKWGKIVNYKHATRGRVYGFQTHLVIEGANTPAPAPAMEQKEDTTEFDNAVATVEEQAAALAAKIDEQQAA